MRVTESRPGTGGGLFTQDGSDSGPEISEPAYQLAEGVVDFGERGPAHPEYDAFLTTAFQDIESFWATAFPDTYDSPWEPLEGGIFAAYPGRESAIPGCGSPTSSYEDVQVGTAFYCIDGDFMAYDDDDGLPALVDELGKEAVAIVLAHEFGHAIQSRAGEWDQPGVLKEQQADCFAGAWAAHVAAGESGAIRFDDADVRAGLIAMIEVRDPIDGQGLADEMAHGTGFDRVSAFKDGFEGGTARCATFFTEGRERTLIDIPFDPTDTNAGNLPVIDPAPDPTTGPNDVITLIPASLDFYWSLLTAQNQVTFTAPAFAAFRSDGPYPSCGGLEGDQWVGQVHYCPEDDVVHWDQDFAVALLDQAFTGDMTIGYLFASAYSDAVLHALGSVTTGEQRVLYADCLTGSWVQSIVPPIPADRENQLGLSAGDLDEAVVVAIATADEHADTDVNGSPFEKIGAFRTGVLDGIDRCNARYGSG